MSDHPTGDLSKAVYELIFSTTDQLGNTATAANTLIIADTDPTVDLSMVTTEPYGEVIINTMFYGLGDGTYTVTAEVSTPLAGIDTVEFGDATSAGRIDLLNGAPNVTLAHEYTFDSSSTYSSTLTVEATDRAANTTASGIPVIRDIVSPTVNISAQSSGLDISLSWSASDESSGLEGCSLTIAVEGDAEEELSTDCSGSMVYPGTQDVAHVFKLTVFDKVFNDATATASTTPNSVTKYYYLGADRVAMRNGDGVFYLHGDHLGSTSLTTDEDGEVVSESRYYPYGEERFADGSRPTDFTFTGQRSETGFGLQDFNARFFSSRIGRFISPDPLIPDLSNSQDWNRYTFVRNNPPKYTDPSGHIGILATVGIGAGIGALVGGGMYVINAKRNGHELNALDFVTAAGAGAVAGGLIGAGIMLPGTGLLNAGVSMSLNLAADHLVDTMSGDEFSASSHAIEGVVGAITPSIARGAGVALGRLPRFSQNGPIVQKAGELLGEGLADGTIATAGNLLESGIQGAELPTEGKIVGHFMAGLVAAPVSYGGEQLGAYFAAGLAAEGASDIWQGSVEVMMEIKSDTYLKSLETLFSYSFEQKD